MRILHTSDWHLGRSFHRVGMLDHQAGFVDHLIEVVESEQVDLVVVAGDIYDRALPHVDAVRLADETFARLAASRAQVVITSGNHDSAQRLGFGSRLIDAAGVYLRTDASSVGTPVLARRCPRPRRGPRHPLSRPAGAPRALGPSRAHPRGRPRPRRCGGCMPTSPGGRCARSCWRTPSWPGAGRASRSETSASAASRWCRRRCSTASPTPRSAISTAGRPCARPCATADHRWPTHSPRPVTRRAPGWSTSEPRA